MRHKTFLRFLQWVALWTSEEVEEKHFWFRVLFASFLLSSSGECSSAVASWEGGKLSGGRWCRGGRACWWNSWVSSDLCFSASGSVACLSAPPSSTLSASPASSQEPTGSLGSFALSSPKKTSLKLAKMPTSPNSSVLSFACYAESSPTFLFSRSLSARAHSNLSSKILSSQDGALFYLKP